MAPGGVGYWGSLGGVKGHQRVSGVYLWTGRECRYSGPRRGIGCIRGYWVALRVLGPLEGVGAIRGCQGV